MQLQPVRLQLGNDYNKEQQKKAYAIKQSLQLPIQQLIQVQIDLWALIPQQKGTSEIQISKAKLQYVSVSPEAFQPTIYIPGQQFYENLTLQMPRQQQKIRTPRLIYDSDVVTKLLPQNKKLQFINILDLVQEEKVQVSESVFQFLQEVQTESIANAKKAQSNDGSTIQQENNNNKKRVTLQSDQDKFTQKSQVQKSQIHKSQVSKSQVKQEVQKKIKSYQEFIQWQDVQRDEGPDAYEFEDLELQIPIFEIQYDLKSIFQQETGKDGFDRRALTPIKIQGRGFRPRRLIGVKPIVRSAEQVDINALVSQYNEEQLVLQEEMRQQEERIKQEQEEQERIQKIKNDIQVEDEDIGFDDIACIVNIKSQRPAFTFEEFVNQSEETEIRDYLLNDLTEKQRNLLKAGVLQGKYTIPHSMAPKIGLIYDLVQQRYYEMGALNDLDDF